MAVPAFAAALAIVAAVQDHGPAEAASSVAAGRAAIAGRVGPAGPVGGKAGPLAGRASPSATSAALRAARSSSAAAQSGARPAASSPASPPHRPPASPHPAALRCSGSSVMLPENYATIVSFLVGHGYSKFAAAGMAGNMWQESKGNPESVGTGGGGLIGWTPLPPGFVTGNAAADLRTQLAAVLTYNQQWSQYIPELNAASSATAAADIYMNYFERPGIPAAANREAAAAAVATACGF